MRPTLQQIKEAAARHEEADRQMAYRYPVPVPAPAGPYLAEYKRYDPDHESEATFATREEAEAWLKRQACHSGIQQVTGWINGERVTATTTAVKYENFGA